MSHFEGYYKDELIENANKLCEHRKGILIADEDPEIVGKRLAEFQIENTPEKRRSYRELIFFPPGNEEYISGVVMHEDSFHQISHYDGRPFLKIFNEWSILPGIRLDTGFSVLACTFDETVAQGLDYLGDRCREYYASGARFATWHAEFKIGLLEPTEIALVLNSHAVGRFAICCQENGLVPLVKVNILIDGEHDVAECAHVTETVLSWVIKALNDHRVMLEGIVLMTSMVTPGAQCTKTVEADVMAEHTDKAVRRTVPPAVPGIVFYSAEQNEEEATLNLNAISRNSGRKPWNFSFAFGKAIQDPGLRTWAGNEENWNRAHKEIHARCRANSRATIGCYNGDCHVSEGGTNSQHESSHNDNDDDKDDEDEEE